MVFSRKSAAIKRYTFILKYTSPRGYSGLGMVAELLICIGIWAGYCYNRRRKVVTLHMMPNVVKLLSPKVDVIFKLLIPISE